MNDAQRVVQIIRDSWRRGPRRAERAGCCQRIDGSGKGYVTDRLVGELRRQGVNSIAINVDGWLNLPSRRFSEVRPAEHFYDHAIRFEEMFPQLVLPLKRQRSIRVEVDFAEETAQEYRRQIYDFQDVDVIGAGRDLSAETGVPEVL